MARPYVQLHNFVYLVPCACKSKPFPRCEYNPTSDIELHLDLLDNTWTEQYTKFDYTIISTGVWFTLGAIYYENNTVVGCHFCPTRNLTELGMAPSHRKVIRNVYEHIIASNYTGTVIYRTTTPVHSDNADTEIEEFERAKGKASEKGMNLRLLDVAYLLLLRPDGHPGLYSVKDGKGISDCLHWCIPGPIDYWNDLLMEMLV